MIKRNRLSRRAVLKTAGAATGLALAGMPRFVHAQAKTATVNLQLGWLAGDNQLGEIVAKQLGYFEEEKINLAIQPGGPNIDGVAIVASGRFELGQVSSSPSLMLAASQKIPVQCFAVGAQEHPYAFFSLPAKPIRTPQDMIGKKIGIQATGKILLTALLKKQNIAEKDVEVVVIGSELTPVMTGQVDAVTGWITNTTTLRALGNNFVTMRLWDHGVKLYALPYYATQDTLQKNPGMVQGFTRAAARGWAYAYQNPEKSVELLLKEYPNLVKPDELEAVPVLNKFVFTGSTKMKGWGTFEPNVWQEQIDLYDQLKQFSAGPPKLAEVMTTGILEATKDARPKLG
ncbi:MAG: ABC transporter substrate-binding protein [Proteobacteria bacterium]|nr:ABC transporter substrate-binding protein [Pseudomonadota bacterium]MBI3497918.1 ABC transporter substrate-binding protein [Pseudomonadota bacterium]